MKILNALAITAALTAVAPANAATTIFDTVFSGAVANGDTIQFAAAQDRSDFVAVVLGFRGNFSLDADVTITSDEVAEKGASITTSIFGRIGFADDTLLTFSGVGPGGYIFAEGPLGETLRLSDPDDFNGGRYAYLASSQWFDGYINESIQGSGKSRFLGSDPISLTVGGSADVNVHYSFRAEISNIVARYSLTQLQISYVYVTPDAPVPEPATWAMMIAGFGMVGGALRRRSTLSVA